MACSIHRSPCFEKIWKIEGQTRFVRLNSAVPGRDENLKHVHSHGCASA